MREFKVVHTKSGHTLAEDGEIVERHWTRNASKKTIKNPLGIVVHGTFGNPYNIKGSISWNQRTDIRARGSAQIYIDREGVVHGMNRLDQVLWHAGTSEWKGVDGKTRTGLNNTYIGIELACAGPLQKISKTQYKAKYSSVRIDLKKDEGEIRSGIHPKYPQHDLWLHYSDKQIEALVAVCRALEDHWPTIDNIITHYDCSPNRKLDCAPTLDMARLRAAVFDREDFFADNDDADDEDAGKTWPYIADSAVGGISIPDAKQIMVDLGFRITDVKSPVVGKTVRASLLELQDDNDLDNSGIFDEPTLTLLASGKAIRKPDPELEKLDVNVLRERGSSTIAAADNDERLAVGVPAVFTGVAGVDAIVRGEFFSGLSAMATGVTNLTKPFGFEIGPWQLLLGCTILGFSAIIMVRAKLRKAKRVRDAKSGKKPR